MDSIIDATYFVRETYLPGVEKPIVKEVINQFVLDYQAQFLKKALGYAFYKVFWADITVALPATPTARMLAIVNGADFDHNGCLSEWEGLRKQCPNSSIIAQYVYFFYMANEATQTHVSGEQRPDTENGKPATPGYKMERQWNNMILELPELWKFLTYAKNGAGQRIYPEFKMSEVDCKHFQRINTFGI